MVGVEEGREFRFRRDLYSQESTFPLVASCYWNNEHMFCGLHSASISVTVYFTTLV